jgi:hypothetical protein
MKELGSAFRTYQANGTTMENLFFIVWSDIGKAFYAKHCWEAFPSSDICLPPASAHRRL